MNIFRTKINEELTSKIESYEVQLKELENSYQELRETNQLLNDKIVELSHSIASKNEVIEEKQEVIEEKQEVIESLEEVIEEKQEIIEEVIENTLSVEKIAAIKALEILSDVGCEVVETIDGPEEIDIMAQMSKLKGEQLVEFYNKNREEIKKHLKK